MFAKSRRLLNNESGMTDLASTVVGVVLMAILTLGISASVIGAIGWSQDHAARQILASVSAAQNQASRGDNPYLSEQDLIDGGYINDVDGIVVVTGSKPAADWDGATKTDDIWFDDPGTCYVATAASKTGKTFYVSSGRAEPDKFVASLRNEKDLRCNLDNGDLDLDRLELTPAQG